MTPSSPPIHRSPAASPGSPSSSPSPASPPAPGPSTARPASAAPDAVRAKEKAAAFDAFTLGMIDYAGLFPPEKLPLAEALAAYASYQVHERAAVIARFVLPASRFPEAVPLLLAPFADVRAGRRAAWVFSALFKAQDSYEAALAALPAELGAVRSFLSVNADVARVDSIECALPVDACDPAVVDRRVATLAGLFRDALPGAVAHFEIPWSVAPGPVVAALKEQGEGLRAKFRTGGLTPASIPSIDALSGALVAVARGGLPTKFTAGLHEPLRHFDAKVGAPLHGFVNVFFATWALAAGKADESLARAILACEDPGAFALHGGGLTFANVTLSVEDIRAGREGVATSFGTCSFLEPLEGLRGMGWLS